VVDGVRGSLVTFKHWLHRALFLLEVEQVEGVSHYAATQLARQRPYLLYLFYAAADEGRLRDAERRTHGKWRAADASRTLGLLARMAWRGQAVYSGGPDVLGSWLGERFFWEDAWCAACGDAECRRGSTQAARCQVVSEDIGALDDIEIRDIFRMYRRGNESLHSCFLRIAEMSGLGAVVDTARPRWPDAYRPDPRSLTEVNS